MIDPPFKYKGNRGRGLAWQEEGLSRDQLFEKIVALYTSICCTDDDVTLFTLMEHWNVSRAVAKEMIKKMVDAGKLVGTLKMRLVGGKIMTYKVAEESADE